MATQAEREAMARMEAKIDNLLIQNTDTQVSMATLTEKHESATKSLDLLSAHVAKQNGRVTKLEIGRAKLTGIAVAVPIFITILGFVVQRL